MYSNPTDQLKKFEDRDRRSRNSEFTWAAKKQLPGNERSYICGLGASVGYEHLSEYSTRSD